jgi:hypothetical protein
MCCIFIWHDFVHILWQNLSNDTRKKTSIYKPNKVDLFILGIVWYSYCTFCKTFPWHLNSIKRRFPSGQQGMLTPRHPIPHLECPGSVFEYLFLWLVIPPYVSRLITVWCLKIICYILLITVNQLLFACKKPFARTPLVANISRCEPDTVYRPISMRNARS